MNRKAFGWVVGVIAILVLATAGTVAQGQGFRCTRFHGTIADYTPASTGGPWDMRGTWTLVLHEWNNTADFSAEMNMEQSDEGIIRMANAAGDTADPTAEFNNPALRGAHTHHIVLQGIAVTQLPTGGFQISGPIKLVTKDGTPAPFAQSTLQVQVTGGSVVKYSNVTLTFIGAATGHFGTQAIHGVVRDFREEEEEAEATAK
ncbi:MAG TPA: hypothetical protein VGD60_15105 [Candidatus Acidoferrales bacterium]